MVTKPIEFLTECNFITNYVVVTHTHNTFKVRREGAVVERYWVATYRSKDACPITLPLISFRSPFRLSFRLLHAIKSRVKCSPVTIDGISHQIGIPHSYLPLSAFCGNPRYLEREDPHLRRIRSGGLNFSHLLLRRIWLAVFVIYFLIKHAFHSSKRNRRGTTCLKNGGKNSKSRFLWFPSNG